MKVLNVVLVCLLLSLNQASLYSQFQRFQGYAKSYNKKYTSTPIQFYRFAIYLQNLMFIQELNADPEDHALYGETLFTDCSLHEVRQLMGLQIPDHFEIKFVKNFTNDHNYQPRTDIPDIWDWNQQGAVTTIKNQGSCGSCWTFSTAGNIESLKYLQNKGQRLVDLSMQQLIDCDKSNFGCAGGWPYHAIDWLANNGGLMKEYDYPLRKNYSGPCLYKQDRERVQIKGYQNITHDQKIIKDALYERGPLSILLDFTGLMHYKSGVANPKFCSTWPDHALVLVGYGIQEEDYWLIKNSWGLAWGINGYFMLKRGANKCAINLWATTAVLQ